MQMHGEIADRYRDFATYARGDSPTFEAWALGVADDPEMHAWLADLPEAKQQPNLVFAAARWHGAPRRGRTPVSGAVLLAEEAAVKATVRQRATQTNEVGRLATLTPVLARLAGPLALVEVGASAGLCLYPDRYDYAWPPMRRADRQRRSDADGRGHGRRCRSRPSTPTSPGAGESTSTRSTSATRTRWRGSRRWSGPSRRTAASASGRPSRWRAGSRRTSWRATCSTTCPGCSSGPGAHGTPVVFHSAVLAYVDVPGRERFHDLMTGLVAEGACRWISNEAPGVLPRVTGGLVTPPGRFVLGLDGVPVAVTHGHGHAIDWL